MGCFHFGEFPSSAQRTLRTYTARRGCGLASLLPSETEELGIQLLVEMVKVCPAARISMASAIEHSYFEKERRCAEESPLNAEDLDLVVDASVVRDQDEVRAKLIK